MPTMPCLIKLCHYYVIKRLYLAENNQIERTNMKQCLSGWDNLDAETKNNCKCVIKKNQDLLKRQQIFKRKIQSHFFLKRII